MNKRAASTTLMMIFEIIIVIFVILMIFEIALSYASSETVNKIVLAENIKMMVNTFVGTPGDALYEFLGNLTKYTFIMTSSTIKVSIQGETKQRTVIRSFFLPQGFSAVGTVNQKEKVCLQKEGTAIILRECE